MIKCSSCGNSFETLALIAGVEVCSQCLAEESDYYMDENGLMVFTEAYHLKRGSCCNSGCRHCPYNKD